jgi:hypothetical protein
MRAAGGTGRFSGALFVRSLSPWSEAQGQSGFLFAYLSAALATTKLPGRMICCPGGRYHPAIVGAGGGDDRGDV